MRQTYKLTDAEFIKLRKLKPIQGEAWLFWARVCNARGLDLGSVIHTDDPLRFTALPLGHGKHWCWPIPLKCRFRPVI